jgi:hypothetical protein
MDIGAAERASNPSHICQICCQCKRRVVAVSKKVAVNATQNSRGEETLSQEKAPPVNGVRFVGLLAAGATDHRASP